MLERIEREWDGTTTPKFTILARGATSSWGFLRERAILEELLNALLRRLLGDYQRFNLSLSSPSALGTTATLHNINPGNPAAYPARTPAAAAGMGEITPSVYDTSWVARIRSREKVAQLAFPAALKWLLQEQAGDGSWSNQPTASSNSLLPTLAALMALRSTPEQSEAVCSAAHRAEVYLHRALKQWSVSQHESVGFEMAAPALLAELEAQHGLTFEFEGKAELLALHAQKLKVAEPTLLYSGHSNLLHTLEAFGPTLDFTRLKPLQAPNGSYGCSPAATAAVLIHSPHWDSAAEQWLKLLGAQEEGSFDRALGCSSRDEGGSVPTAYSIDLFERAWVLYDLSVNPRFNKVAQLASNSATTSRFPALKKLVKSLFLSLGSEGEQKGVSISELGGLPPDGDDTGMAIAALNRLGCPTSVASLFQFEREDHFACFETERDISVSANAHILAAFLSYKKVPLSLKVIGADSKNPPQIEVLSEEYNRVINKLVNYLYGARHGEGYWLDKWHLSPYYATSCAALALLDHPSLAVRKTLMPTLEWLLRTQSAEDGGWGWYGCSAQFNNSRSSLEETAYALQVLRAMPPELVSTLPHSRLSYYQAAIKRGRSYLWQHLRDIYTSQSRDSNGLLPRLWQGKELYTPLRVVEAVMLSALY